MRVTIKLLSGIFARSALGLAAVLLSLSAQAEIYFDKATFIAEAKAVPATGPLPPLGSVANSQPVGDITIFTPSWIVQEWTSLLPGNDIAVSNGLGTNMPLADGIVIITGFNVQAAGFDFHEPSLTGSGLNTCGLATCIDSTFSIRAVNSNGDTVESFLYEPPNDVAAFVGFTTDEPFNQVVIEETIGNNDNEFYGEVYVGFGDFPATMPIENPQPTSNDRFGESVSIHNGFALVGAFRDDATGGDSGRAYLFNTDTGELVRIFENPSPGTNDWFGISVDLTDGLAVVGALGDDTTGTDSGRAYLFDTATGALLHTFENPSPGTSTDGDRFGQAVSVGDGRVLVGAPFDDRNTAVADTGSAYLFDATTGGLVRWLPFTTADARFGTAVSLGDGRALVGAPQGGSTRAGTVQLFNAATGGLLRTYPSLYTYPRQFGHAVDIDDGLIVIGAYEDGGIANEGRAMIYDYTDVVNPVAILTSPAPNEGRFGFSVSMKNGKVLVGAPVDDTSATDAGRAYVFDTAGRYRRAVDNPSLDASDWFGEAVAMDGDTGIVGALFDDTSGSNSGRVFVLKEGLQTSLDVLPGNTLNDVHPHHDGRFLTLGSLPDDLVPVVVYGTDELDTSLIDNATVRFGPGRGGVAPATVPVIMDYDGDALMDTSYEFYMSDAVIACESGAATLVGETTTSEFFVGTDFVGPDCDAQCHN